MAWWHVLSLCSSFLIASVASSAWWSQEPRYDIRCGSIAVLGNLGYSAPLGKPGVLELGNGNASQSLIPRPRDVTSAVLFRHTNSHRRVCGQGVVLKEAPSIRGRCPLQAALGKGLAIPPDGDQSEAIKNPPVIALEGCEVDPLSCPESCSTIGSDAFSEIPPDGDPSHKDHQGVNHLAPDAGWE